MFTLIPVFSVTDGRADIDYILDCLFIRTTGVVHLAQPFMVELKNLREFINAESACGAFPLIDIDLFSHIPFIIS